MKNFLVVLATPLYPPQSGGPATRTKTLEKELPSRGWKTRTVSFSSVLHLPSGIRHVVYCIKLLWALRGADVLLAQDAASVGLPALIATKLARKPLVVVFVGDFVWEQMVVRFGLRETLDEFQEREKLPWPYGLLRKGQAFILRSATQVVVPSVYLQELVVRFGVPAERVRVVYNPLPTVSVPGNRQSLRDTYGYTGFVIFSVGRLVPWKGFETLIRVTHALRDRHPEVRLVIAGDGPERQRLSSEIRRLRAHAYVTLLGDIPNQEVLERIAAADLFVLYTGYEGLSHVLVEALAVGTPIVTTTAGGNPEVITHGRNGVLVTYGDDTALVDAITQAIVTPEIYSRLAIEGKKTVPKFTVQQMVDEIATILART